MNPPMGYNHTDTGGPKIEHFDIFEPDVRLGVDGKPKDTFQSILPDEVNVKGEQFNFLKYLNEKEGKQLGLEDLGALGSNIKLQLANDTAEKMLESIGPVGQGIAARVEKANKSVGQRVKYLILQWFDTQRIMEYVGPDKMAPEVFDYKPNDLVPSHLPDEMVGGQFPETESKYTNLERARWFVKQIRLISVPSTLLKVTQMQQQLFYVQLKKMGAPISWLTIFRSADVPSPEAEIESSFQEQEKLEKMKLMAQIDIAMTMKKMGIDPAQMGGGDAGGGKPHAGGRPSSGQSAPKIRQKGAKGGDPRSTVTESK
jgi:hypothetical protein